jgi:hypothetical protein
LNSHHESIPFILPAHRRKVRWEVTLDTFDPSSVNKKPRSMRGGEAYELQGRSLTILRLPKHVAGEDENGDGIPTARRGRRGVTGQRASL